MRIPSNYCPRTLGRYKTAIPLTDAGVVECVQVGIDIVKALFMTVWRPSTRSAENSCGIRQS